MTRIVVRRAKFEGGEGKKGRRMFPNETTQDIPIGLLTEIRSVRVLPASPLSLFLSPLSSLLLGPSLFSEQSHRGACAYDCASLVARAPRQGLRSCASTPSFAPETVYNPLPSPQATVLPPRGEQPFSRSRHPSLSSLHG